MMRNGRRNKSQVLYSKTRDDEERTGQKSSRICSCFKRTNSTESGTSILESRGTRTFTSQGPMQKNQRMEGRKEDHMDILHPSFTEDAKTNPSIWVNTALIICLDNKYWFKK